MRSSLSEFVGRATIFFVLLLICYVIGYLVTVKRSTVSTSGPPGDTYWMVAADLRGPVGRALFGPALHLDRHYFRRHYWAEWYEKKDANGETKAIYLLD